MRKTTVIFCLAASCLLILDRFGAFEALLLFIIAGVIPGTKVSVPYYGMLILIAFATLLFAWRLGRSKDLRKFLRKYSKVVKSPKKSLPKRRFSQI